MSATTVINSSIPAGQSVSATFATSQPFRGIQLIQSQTMNAKTKNGCRVSYQVSIDGGTIFSTPQAVGHEPNSSISPSVSHCAILLNETADHVLFTVQNYDYADPCTNFTLQAECFT